MGIVKADKVATSNLRRQIVVRLLVRRWHMACEIFHMELGLGDVKFQTSFARCVYTGRNLLSIPRSIRKRI